MHSADSRAAAAAVPLVLQGERGHTVAGYMPAPEDLDRAAPAKHAHRWQPVRGPHLIAIRRRDRRNRSGIVGISWSLSSGYIYVNLGSTSRKFNTRTLGRAEALRRAVALRAAHEAKVAQANAAILAARAAAEGGAA